MKEKVGRENHKIKVDMAAVSRLQTYQMEMRNNGINCSLILGKDAPCHICCPHVKECKHFSVERDYINKKKNAYWTLKRRREKKQKQQAKNKMLNSYDEEDPYEEEDEELSDQEIFLITSS